MDPLAAAFGAHVLAGEDVVTTPDQAVADALGQAGLDVAVEPLDRPAPESCAAVALLADELSRAGEHAEAVVAAAARALQPGSRLAVTAVSAAYEASRHDPTTGARRPRPERESSSATGPRAFTAETLARLLGVAGFEVAGQWAPGAAARLGGRAAAFEPETDRTPGLLDAAPRVAAVAYRYRDRAARERAFFSSLPRKVVAAAVVCRDARGRLLIVHDAFKRHWTIPGGVVDADEDPRAGAAREAREESGVDVDVGPLLGVFSRSWPDRLVLVYGAQPTGDLTPRPVHAHEIDAAEWVDLDAALSRLAAPIADHVRRCLETPGGTWAD